MDTKQFESLIPGNNYTIWGLSEFGFPYSFKARMTEVQIRPYAQYKESIVLYFVPKGKRKSRGMRILPDNCIMIWEGWHDISDDMFVDNSGMSLACFDRKYADIAKQSIDLDPIISQM